MEPSPLSSFPGSGGTTQWSQLLQKKAPRENDEPVSCRLFGNCGSSEGVSLAVLDASAIVQGDKMSSTADRFVTVREVLEEVRDPTSRQRLSFLPFTIETMEPAPDAIKKVVKFARETGDLQTLSDVDIKLIALTYMLEAQIHGTDHLKSVPPPIQMVNLKSLPESEMPGWGSNVPNLEEWEALEQAENESNNGSRILPLKDLNLNVTHVNEDARKLEKEAEHLSSPNTQRVSSHQKEMRIGNKMVVDGIDASHGEDTDNADDWQPAVSRAAQRRYLRRKARFEPFDASDDSLLGCTEADEPGAVHTAQEVETSRECVLSNGLEHMSLEDEGPDASVRPGPGDDEGLGMTDKADVENYHDRRIEIPSETDGSINAPQGCSPTEPSCVPQSLSNSTVACVTGDFAMQNVILQMGLRLLAPSGMQIRQLHRWVLKCHACNKVTSEIGRLFCPKCGNGGTLRKVSVTVGENGLILASRRPRVNLRGTKFSIPLPQGGRDGISKNLVLREDQIPRKLLYPKGKKKNNKQDKDGFGAEDIFSHASERKAPLKPPVGKAVLVFTGKRNPNDNHFSRRH
ncbi:unnamed protein product [Spirodela intermedia]|uniref:Uncharacterized protein n=1 Tax=Spirodela intermedia TaxID=51605 RepID=A0A7I8K3B0_SPIIN|nr:unnamed protein product [Spirodela intermedia]